MRGKTTVRKRLTVATLVFKIGDSLREEPQSPELGMALRLC